MYIYNLAEVKKEIKNLNTVKIVVNIQEFGEGYDTYIDVQFLDKYLNNDFNSYQLGEEEKKTQAIQRAKRAYNSLCKHYNNVTFEGLVNC